jgi:predicted transcriptional regulator
MASAHLTEEKLEYRAEHLRTALGYRESDEMNPLEFIERFKRYWRPQFTFEVVEDNALPYSEAEAAPCHHHVKMRQSTYDALVDGDRRAGFIVIEEICHIVLKHDGTMHRTMGRDFFAKASARKGAQEREAKYMAAAVIAPYGIVEKIDSLPELQGKPGLSTEAARIRFGQVQDIKRKRNGQLRPFTPKIIEEIRILEAKTGIRVNTFRDA